MKRARGKKLPPGEVKSAILTHLMGKGESSFEEIRTFLRDKYSIKSTSGIRNHLEYLQGHGCISVKQLHKTEKYYLNSYVITPGFNTFKKLFNYYKKNNRTTELMTSKYYGEYVQSTDFADKYLLNMYRENLLKLYRIAEAKGEKRYIDWAFEGEYVLEHIRTFEKHGVDETFDLLNRDIKEKGKALVFFTNYEDFDVYMHNEVMTWDEEDCVIKMILRSPSVIDYILNPKYADPTSIPAISLVPAALGKDAADMFLGGMSEYLDPYSGKSRECHETFTFTILKSLFISDIVNEKLLPEQP